MLCFKTSCVSLQCASAVVFYNRQAATVGCAHSGKLECSTIFVSFETAYLDLWTMALQPC